MNNPHEQDLKEQSQEAVKNQATDSQRYSADLPDDADQLAPDPTNVDETVKDYLEHPESKIHPGVPGQAQGNPTRQNEGLSGVTTRGGGAP